LVVSVTSLTINCSVTPNGSITVTGTPAGLTATSASPNQAVVGAPMVVNGNTTFVITGEGTVPTTITLADTAGAVATVAVTPLNCPFNR